jgi:hypothetical protein
MDAQLSILLAVVMDKDFATKEEIRVMDTLPLVLPIIET